MTSSERVPPPRRTARTGVGRVGGGVSRWVDLDGPLHYLDFGGPAAGPVIVAVHGLGGSALNWAALAPYLADRYRVLAPDLAGHGRTQSLGRSAGALANATLVRRFVRAVPGGPVLLMGNSMGGMISISVAADDPELVSGLVLVDPALPVVAARPDPAIAVAFAAYSLPLLGRTAMLARNRVLTPEAAVHQMLALCCHDVGRVPSDVVAAEIVQSRARRTYPGVEADFLEAARSVVATVARRGRYRDRLRRLAVPVLLVHGTKDRLVPLPVAKATARAHREWTFVELADVGHVPQLEAAEETARTLREWLTGPGREAAAEARPGGPGMGP